MSFRTWLDANRFERDAAEEPQQGECADDDEPCVCGGGGGFVAHTVPVTVFVGGCGATVGGVGGHDYQISGAYSA